MRARICDKCGNIIRGPYQKVLTIGKGRIYSGDFHIDCLATNPPAKEPKTRRLYDVPLDGSPIKVHVVQDAATLTHDEVDRILNQGDYPPNPSPK